MQRSQFITAVHLTELESHIRALLSNKLKSHCQKLNQSCFYAIKNEFSPSISDTIRNYIFEMYLDENEMVDISLLNIWLQTLNICELHHVKIKDWEGNNFGDRSRAVVVEMKYNRCIKR